MDVEDHKTSLEGNLSSLRKKYERVIRSSAKSVIGPLIERIKHFEQQNAQEYLGSLENDQEISDEKKKELKEIVEIHLAIIESLGETRH